MKLKRSTVVLVGVALLMGAGVLIAESQRSKTPQTAEVEGAGAPILPFEESAVTQMQVERDSETLVFEKDDEGNWQMTQPDSGPAEPGAVAYLLSRLNTDAPLQIVAMQPGELADFGLDNPVGTVMVILEDGTEHQLILGGEDFSGSARYAVIDPETWPPAADAAEEISVLVVSQDVANGINRPLEEWKLPIEAATEEGEATETTGGAAASDTAADPIEEPAAEETGPAEDTATPAGQEPTAEEESAATEATEDTAPSAGQEPATEAESAPEAAPESTETAPTPAAASDAE